MKSAPETEIETPKHVYKILNALFNLEQTNNKSQYKHYHKIKLITENKESLIIKKYLKILKNESWL